MENSEELTLEEQKIVVEAIKSEKPPDENLVSDEGESSETEHPDYDDYYEVQDEEPEMEIKKGETRTQKENDSEEYY